MEKAEPDDLSLTVTKLCLGADYYANICPALSRTLMSQLCQIKPTTDHAGQNLRKSASYCVHCGQVFRPENHSIKVSPRQRLNKNIKRLQRKVTNKKRGLARNLMRNYESGYNFLKINCFKCGKQQMCQLYSRSARTELVNSFASNPGAHESTTLTKSQKKKLKAKKKLKERLVMNEYIAASRKIMKAATQAQSDGKRKFSEMPSSSQLSKKSGDPHSTATSTAPDRQNSMLKSSGTRSSLSQTEDAEAKKNKKAPSKKSFSKLQTMLATAQEEEQQARQSQNSLASFLGSL